MGSGWSRFKGLFWQPAEDDDGTDDGEILEALSALKDLEGIVGSIAVDVSGQVRAADLPRIFDERTIELIGSKMLELRSVLTNDHRETISGCLEFEGHSFHVKVFPLGMIGVLLNDKAERPALVMALNLVSRRVASTLESIAGGVEP